MSRQPALRHAAKATTLLGGALVSLGLLLGGAAAAGAAPLDAAQPAAQPGALPEAPLNSSLQVAGAQWAVLPMGDLGKVSDTFWQLVVLRSGATRWSLVTPPGVADNGGLVAAAGSHMLLSGFEPSQDLRFSPIAATSDVGQHWSPGILSSPLARVPDALSLAASGGALALVDQPTSSLLSSSGDLSSWRPVLTASRLAKEAGVARCGPNRLDAVAAAPGGTLLGVACAKPGIVGIYEQGGSSWRPVGPALPSAERGAQSAVLRLTDVAGGVSGLIATTLGNQSWLSATRRGTTTGAFSISAPLALAPGQAITASGALPDGSVFALLSGHSGPRAVVLRAGAPAEVLPSPPRGSATLAFGSARVDALVVQGSSLTDYTLDAASRHWVKRQVLQVPIQFGSSG